MIPNNEGYEYHDDEDEELGSDFELESEPSFTYAMQISDDETRENRFVGKTDDIDAMKQAILKILNTERYENEIYSWDYGIELKDLFGMDIAYVMSEVQTRIIDAITADGRFGSVDDLEVEQTGKHTIHATFTVTTSEGYQIREGLEVAT